MCVVTRAATQLGCEAANMIYEKLQLEPHEYAGADETDHLLDGNTKQNRSNFLRPDHILRCLAVFGAIPYSRERQL